MSVADVVDETYNATSLPPSGSYTPTEDQFFCQLTKEDFRCVNSSQFAIQPFEQLCPSGDCWQDCQDLERLYSPVPSGIFASDATAYGRPPNITFWSLCAGLTNITESFQAGVAPEAEAATFQPFFNNKTQENLRSVTAATTQCWTDTCAKARWPDKCADPCAAVNILENQTVTQLKGTRECIQAVCSGVDGLPFGNQDVVGIGVSVRWVVIESY